MSFIFLILIPIIFIINFYAIGSFLVKINNYKKDVYELIVLGFAIYILILNYIYFFSSIDLFIFVALITLLSIFFLIFEFFKKKNISNYLRLIIILFVTNLIISLVAILYGEQFYVFRGNIYDFFSYLSTASIISNHNYGQILNIISSESFKNPLLIEYSNFIHSRPSTQIFLASINQITDTSIFVKGFALKSICILLTYISSYSFFSNYLKKKYDRIIYSFGFVFSSFFFYIYEIDALAHLLSLPLMIIIFKNILEFKNQNNNSLFSNLIFITIYSACFFIVYPEGASVILLPAAIYILYLILINKNKIYSNKITLLTGSLAVFLLLTLPLYKSTYEYLFFVQLKNGLNSTKDFWGYYGAFILGKSNPIYNEEVVSSIKNLWNEKSSIYQILNSVIDFNIDSSNQYYFLNILPSLFGFYHLTTDNNNNIFLNYLFVILLLILNLYLIKIIIERILHIFRDFTVENNFFKILIVYFIILSFYLLGSKNYWSVIKVYSFFCFFIYFFLLYDFKKKLFVNKFNKIIIFILLLFPIYKYSSFNNGIGAIDSFPSIMKKELKLNTSWVLDYKKISNCYNISYEFNDKFKEIYVKLALNDFKINGIEDSFYDCKIIYNKNAFQILDYE